MAATLEIPQTQDTVAADGRRTWFVAALALAGSLTMLTSLTPTTVSPTAYWAVSSIALATVLIVFVAGENAWDRTVASARAAGVVGR